MRAAASSRSVFLFGFRFCQGRGRFVFCIEGLIASTPEPWACRPHRIVVSMALVLTWQATKALELRCEQLQQRLLSQGAAPLPAAPAPSGSPAPSAAAARMAPPPVYARPALPWTDVGVFLRAQGLERLAGKLDEHGVFCVFTWNRPASFLGSLAGSVARPRLLYLPIFLVPFAMAPLALPAAFDWSPCWAVAVAGDSHSPSSFLQAWTWTRSCSSRTAT